MNNYSSQPPKQRLNTCINCETATVNHNLFCSEECRSKFTADLANQTNRLTRQAMRE